MGNTAIAQVSTLAILLMFTTFFMTLQARSLHGYPSLVHKNVDIQSLFHKSGIDPSKLMHIQFDIIPRAPGDRLSPGGPDPQHNGRAPPRKL